MKCDYCEKNINEGILYYTITLKRKGKPKTNSIKHYHRVCLKRAIKYDGNKAVKLLSKYD